jgi:hypothetical protein
MQGKSTIGPEEQQEAWAKMLTAIDPSRGSFGGPRFASSLVPIPELQRRAARSRRAAAEELSCGDPCSRTGLHGIVPTESRGVENRATTRHGRDHGRPPAVLAIAPQPCPIRERHTRPRATAVVEMGQPAIGISWDVTGHFGGRERSLPGRTLGAAWVPRQGKPSGDGARASCWPDSLCFRHTIPMYVLPGWKSSSPPRIAVATLGTWSQSSVEVTQGTQSRRAAGSLFTRAWSMARASGGTPPAGRAGRCDLPGSAGGATCGGFRQTLIGRMQIREWFG